MTKELSQLIKTSLITVETNECLNPDYGFEYTNLEILRKMTEAINKLNVKKVMIFRGLNPAVKKKLKKWVSGKTNILKQKWYPSCRFYNLE